jgi:exo-1,4-beta-D-glucosaminidase
MAYESHRAMFEAQARNKYVATGFIQWMANNAWPGTIWHLWDYYLRQGGSYFGARAALRPLHVQFSYDDLTVWVVNSTLKVHQDLHVRAILYDAKSSVIVDRSIELPMLDADSGVEALSLSADIGGNQGALDPVYFLDLRLADPNGAELDRNFYWLSTKTDTFQMVHDGSELPDVDHADMTALADLPEAKLVMEPFSKATSDGVTTVTQGISNQSDSIAFFVEILLLDAATDDPILPAMYSDNYVSLAPHESRTLTVRVAEESIAGRLLRVRVSGLNLAP